jgi:GT2 family glycosyltransferase
MEATFIVCNKSDFVSRIVSLIKSPIQMNSLSHAGRILIEEKYDWKRISNDLGRLIYRWRSNVSSLHNPYFSVIVPSYERHDLLTSLMNRLSKQAFGDFEVIVVDQSSEEWPDKSKEFSFSLLYIHTDVKGAVKARDAAAFYARGEVLAFTDDDCEPSFDWLQNAYNYVSRPNVIGVEGLIKSDKIGDPDYRTVSNEGFEGIGFLTANLFLKTEVFNAINGFDEQFENPHFREDTDLAWRALNYGAIPYCRDVVVFHPPHKRNIKRESNAERDRFFEKDALLLRKHPEKYRELFLREDHWMHTPGFWSNFFEGAKKYGVEIPGFYIDMFNRSPQR